MTWLTGDEVQDLIDSIVFPFDENVSDFTRGWNIALKRLEAALLAKELELDNGPENRDSSQF